jgi:hypothetical protein
MDEGARYLRSAILLLLIGAVLVATPAGTVVAQDVVPTTADPRLNDRVADNVCKFDDTESETLLFGRNFGVATDLQTGPNGTLFVVSLSNGAIYEIFRQKGSDHGNHGSHD